MGEARGGTAPLIPAPGGAWSRGPPGLTGPCPPNRAGPGCQARGGAVAERYECEDPPCLHVVVDYSRKVFAVFLETAEGDIIYIPFDKLAEAYSKASSLVSKRFREARGRDVDYLAQEHLGAEPVEEE